VTLHYLGFAFLLAPKMTQIVAEEKGGSRWRRSSSVCNMTGTLCSAKLLNSQHFHRGWTRKPH